MRKPKTTFQEVVAWTRVHTQFLCGFLCVNVSTEFIRIILPVSTPFSVGLDPLKVKWNWIFVGMVSFQKHNRNLNQTGNACCTRLWSDRVLELQWESSYWEWHFSVPKEEEVRPVLSHDSNRFLFLRPQGFYILMMSLVTDDCFLFSIIFRKICHKEVRH